MSEERPQVFAGEGPEKSFRDALAHGRFMIQRCRGCAKHVFYPRAMCPHCGSVDLDWVAASGRGTVYSTTIVRRRAEEGGDYNIALVDLAEGPRLMSRVEGLAPSDVRIGMPVRARIERLGDLPAIVFDPVAEGAR
jgi:uncharacterized OB-fold protein